jgi:hypothetical protein
VAVNRSRTLAQGPRQEETIMAFEQSCPNCGMAREDWQGNNGQGYTAGRETYCCEGCATGRGCTCEAKQHRAGRLGDLR